MYVKAVSSAGRQVYNNEKGNLNENNDDMSVYFTAFEAEAETKNATHLRSMVRENDLSYVKAIFRHEY